MSFNPAIPEASNFLAISQKQLLANYQAIFNTFSINHVAINSSNQGQHNSFTLRPQSGDPTTSATQCALYSKIVSSTPQAFFRPKSNGTPIQLTNSNFSTISNPGVEFRQSTFVAGPFTMYMGYILNVTIPTTVTLTPSTTLIYVGLSVVSDPSTVGITQAVPTSISGNQFIIKASDGISSFKVVYYMAIGI